MARRQEIIWEEFLGPYRVRLWLHGPVLGKKNVVNPPHRHSHHEFHLILSGRGQYVESGKKTPFAKGTVLATNPGVEHHTYPEGPGVVDFLYIDALIEGAPSRPTYVKELELRILTSYLTAHRPCTPGADVLLGYLPLVSRSAGSAGTRLALRALWFEMLVVSCDFVDHGPPALLDPLDRAIAYIEQNVWRPVRLSEVAKTACVSPRTLQRVFKNRLDTSVGDVIRRKKLEFARRLLSWGMSARDAGAAIGIEEPSQFSRLHKEVFGETPGGFAKRVVSEQARSTLDYPRNNSEE